MKTRIGIAIVCLLAFTAVTAYTSTERVSEGNYAALGWLKTLKVGVVGNSPSCTFSVRAEFVPAGEGMMIYANKSASTTPAWAGLSKMLTPGTALNTITSLNIRTSLTQGTLNEPPSVYFGVMVDGVSHNIRALPWATLGRGNQWQLYEYNLLGSMKWYDRADNLSRTWDEFLALYPTAQLATDAESVGLPSSQNFNIFAGAAGTGTVEYNLARDSRGMADWVEIGFDGGDAMRYDFVVPEPSSILAMFTGMLGLLALRRKR